MLSGVNLLCHNSIRITKDKTIYVDPYKVQKEYKDADIIFCTHSHYDHFSPEDIQKVKKDDTVIVVTQDCLEECLKINFSKERILIVKPGDKLKLLGIEVDVVPAYNIDKKYHPQENNWVGYVLEINDITYYIAGDTDITPENKSINCDVAFLPIGGTYTMNAKEAAELANIIEPQTVIPTHYGVVCGSKEDAEVFKNNLNENIECIIM